MYTSGGETCSVECYPKENYVIKQFKPRKPKYGWEVEPLRQTLDLCVQREIICLERLQNEKGFPKILDYNEKEKWIKMTWVGLPFTHFALPEREKYVEQVDPLIDSLEKHSIQVAYDFHIQWSKVIDKNGKSVRKTGYCKSMMMVKEYELSLIDFERAWPLGCEQEAIFNDTFRDSFDSHDNNEFRRTLKHTIKETIVEEPQQDYEIE